MATATGADCSQALAAGESLPAPSVPTPPPETSFPTETQASGPPPSPEPRKRSARPGWAAPLALLVLANAAVGGYAWQQLDGMARPSPSPVTPQPAAALPPPSAAALPPPSPPPSSAEETNLAAPDRSPVASATVAEPSPPAPSRETQSRPAPRQPLQVMVNAPTLDPDLGRGYDYLLGGRLEAAREHYEKVGQADPHNVDALLGLAAIAERQGRKEEAQAYYQRALATDPMDAATQAAVIGAGMMAEPAAAESRLKNLLAARPEAPALNFVLGNLYASQSRWAEAQQAYFSAVAGDADNPDYRFNLAVSLDHLRQPTLAVRHYRLAQEAAARRPAAFDPESLTRRLQKLPAGNGTEQP